MKNIENIIDAKQLAQETVWLIDSCIGLPPDSHDRVSCIEDKLEQLQTYFNELSDELDKEENP